MPIADKCYWADDRNAVEGPRHQLIMALNVVLFQICRPPQGARTRGAETSIIHFTTAVVVFHIRNKIIGKVDCPSQFPNTVLAREGLYFDPCDGRRQE